MDLLPRITPSKLDEQMQPWLGNNEKKFVALEALVTGFDQQRSSRTFAGLEETFLEPRVAGSWIRFEWFHHTQKVSVKRTLEVLDGFGHSIWQKLHIFQRTQLADPHFFASFLEISREQLATYSKRTDWKSVFSHPGGSWIFWIRGKGNFWKPYSIILLMPEIHCTKQRRFTGPSDPSGSPVIRCRRFEDDRNSRCYPVWFFTAIGCLYIYMIINI